MYQVFNGRVWNGSLAYLTWSDCQVVTCEIEMSQGRVGVHICYRPSSANNSDNCFRWPSHYWNTEITVDKVVKDLLCNHELPK